MFFILSKILLFMVSPLVWMGALFIWTYFTMDPAKKKKRLIWSIGVSLFFSNAFIFDEFNRAWEMRAVNTKELGHYEVAIVLGGVGGYDPTFERMEWSGSVDRLLLPLRLYKEGKVEKLLLSGGSSRLIDNELRPMDYVKEYLIDLGVLPSDIIVERESRNTKENAEYCLPIIRENGFHDSECLLVTSARHMRRSELCFNKQGLYPDLLVVDRHAGPRKFEFDHMFIPNIGTLAGWESLLHEIVGTLTYRVMGYC
jgi:uncharacterized SAM-binding protein YcdF (DUF218 family)